MLNLSLNQASRRLSVAKGPARALNSASTTCCSVRAVGGLPSSRRSLREKSATRPTLPCTKRNKQQQQEEERSHLLLCRATPEQDTEAPEQESPSESRKLLKNVFYVASAIALPIVAWSEVVTITTGEGKYRYTTPSPFLQIFQRTYPSAVYSILFSIAG